MENTPLPASPVQFGLFQVDFRSGELRKHGIKVKLQKQPLQILAMLLERPGQVVTREELRTRLWPADTFVDFDRGLNKAMNKLRDALGDSAEKPRFIETLARRGYRFLVTPATRPGRIESLVVLPLRNLSRDPEQEYFADGITEALINSLAKIGALRVISRTTAMRYKLTDKRLPQIAKELSVDAVVEGTVQRSAERVCISAQLIQASTDTHLWAESYERDLRDVLALQSEIARAVAKEIQVKLTPQEQTRLTRASRVEPAAFEAYLKGRHFWNRRTGDDLAKAAECFQRAIEKDPGYAAAYAGLADCANIAGWWGFSSPEEGCAKAKKLAIAALEIDPMLAEGHTAMAWAVAYFDYDFSKAEAIYRRSIELDPHLAQSHQWLGHLLAALGRTEEGIAELHVSLRLDPLSLIFNATLGWVYFCGRRYRESLEQAKKSVELEPNYLLIQWGLGIIYREFSDHESAFTHLRKAVELSQGVPVMVASLGEAFALAGQRQEAENILAQLDQLSKQRYVTPYLIARIYAALHMDEEALSWLEEAYRTRAAWMTLLKVDQRWDRLRSTPRFKRVFRGMNFPAD